MRKKLPACSRWTAATPTTAVMTAAELATLHRIARSRRSDLAALARARRCTTSTTAGSPSRPIHAAVRKGCRRTPAATGRAASSTPAGSPPTPTPDAASDRRRAARRRGSSPGLSWRRGRRRRTRPWPHGRCPRYPGRRAESWCRTTSPRIVPDRVDPVIGAEVAQAAERHVSTAGDDAEDHPESEDKESRRQPSTPGDTCTERRSDHDRQIYPSGAPNATARRHNKSISDADPYYVRDVCGLRRGARPARGGRLAAGGQRGGCGRLHLIGLGLLEALLGPGLVELDAPSCPPRSARGLGGRGTSGRCGP